MFLSSTTLFLRKAIWVIGISFILFSCTVVKEYQPNKPFVYETKVTVKGNVSKDTIKLLTTELDNYWDDSMRARKLLSFGVKYTIRKPPVYDTIALVRSKKFMQAYLNSQGFYYVVFDTSKIKFDTVVQRKKQQIRVSIEQTINLGKNIIIDSVSFTLSDSALQSLVKQQESASFVKKGNPYSKQVISDELDRLVTLIRDSGYYKFTREDIYALVDTSNQELFKLTLDPIEQAKIIAAAEKQRREDPRWKIDIRLRDIKDSSKLTKYYVGKVYFYPETKITDVPDSLITKKWAKQTRGNSGNYIIRDYEGKFKLRPLREHTYLLVDTSTTRRKRGDTSFRFNRLYSETMYFKTINALSQIPAWKQVDARILRRGNDSLDVHLFLEPAIRETMTYNADISRNSNDFSSGNLLGLTLSTTYINRNLWKSAVQSNTSLRAGVEFNFDTATSAKNLIQTFQIGLNQNFVWPRLITPRFIRALGRKGDNKRSVASFGGSYIERFDTYRLRQFTGSFAWEWQPKKKRYSTSSISLKPLNIELYKIDTLPQLDVIFKQNPFLRNSFNTGNVIGASFTQTINFNSKKKTGNSSLFRYGIDESGLLLGVLPLNTVKSWQDKIYQYVKLEVDYKFSQKRKKSELAYHFYSGVGIPLGGQSLPFFKQFTAGGPNSMRAWGLRQLGLGSSRASDTISSNSFRDRFGDMQLETNLEYRFTIFNLNGFKIGSALFADIGNVWNVKKDPANQGAEFSFNRLAKDIAVGVGTGIRFDFSYFLVRVDFAYKVKDPGRSYNNGWMKDFRWKEERNNATNTEVRNFNFQLGIGLPF